jgi:TonB family protein
MLRAAARRAFLSFLLGSGLAFAGEIEWRAHMQAGESQQRRGDSAAATTSFGAALREAEGFGPQDRRLAETLTWVAANHQAQGRLAEAENHFRRALAIREAVDGPNHFEVSRILNSIAANYLIQGRLAEAEPLLERAIAIAEKTSGQDQQGLAMGLFNLGQLKQEQGRFAEAEPLYRRALAAREKARGQEHPLLVAHLDALAALYVKTGNLDQAELFSARLLALREKVLGPWHADVAKSLHELADVRRAQGRLVAAEPLYLRALQILKSKSSVLAQRDAANVEAKLDELQRMQGRSADVPQPEQQAAKRPAQEDSERAATAATLIGNQFSGHQRVLAPDGSVLSESRVFVDGRRVRLEISQRGGVRSLSRGGAGAMPNPSQSQNQIFPPRGASDAVLQIVLVRGDAGEVHLVSDERKDATRLDPARQVHHLAPDFLMIMPLFEDEIEGQRIVRTKIRQEQVSNQLCDVLQIIMEQGFGATIFVNQTTRLPVRVEFGPPSGRLRAEWSEVVAGTQPPELFVVPADYKILTTPDASQYRVSTVGKNDSESLSDKEMLARNAANNAQLERLFSGQLVSPTDAPLKILNAPLPNYPESLRSARIEGIVRVRFQIEVDGTVSNPTVIGTPPNALVELSLSTIRQWKFEPLTANGQRINHSLLMEFEFKLAN